MHRKVIPQVHFFLSWFIHLILILSPKIFNSQFAKLNCKVFLKFFDVLQFDYE